MHHPVPVIGRSIKPKNLDPVPDFADGIPKPELVLSGIVLETIENGGELASANTTSEKFLRRPLGFSLRGF
jgi:hypothetical protein